MTPRPGPAASGEGRLRALLVAGSVLAGLAAFGAAELLLRALPPASLRDAPALQPYVHSPLYGWKLRPGFAGAGRDGRAVRINRAGFRGEEPGPGPPGRRRVLLLGDSLTFGTGVDDAETFAAQLRSVAPGLEPLNLGVSGYGTDQELLLLEHEGWALRPSVVVLNVCVGNDVLDNALPVYLYDGATPKPYFTAQGGALELHAEDVRLPLPSLLARRLVERSLALDALRLLAGGATRAPLDHDDGEHWGPRARAVLERWPEAEALTRLLLARLAEGCARNGARLLVLLHPNRRAYEGDDEWVRAFRLDAPEGGTARLVDLREAYGRRGLRWEDFALDKLGHLNPRGHRVVAEVLKEALLE